MTTVVEGPLKGWIPLVAFLRLATPREGRLLAAAGAVVESDIRRDTLSPLIGRWRAEYAHSVRLLSLKDIAGGILITLGIEEPSALAEETVAQALDIVVGWAHLRTFGIVSARDRARLIAERMALSQDRTLVEMGEPNLEPDSRIRFEFSISEKTDPERRYRADVIVDPFGRRPDEHRSPERK